MNEVFVSIPSNNFWQIFIVVVVVVMPCAKLIVRQTINEVITWAIINIIDIFLGTVL